MGLQKQIVKQQKERTKLRANIEKLEQSINLDGLYNKVYEIEVKNEDLEE